MLRVNFGQVGNIIVIGVQQQRNILINGIYTNELSQFCSLFYEIDGDTETPSVTIGGLGAVKSFPRAEKEDKLIKIMLKETYDLLSIQKELFAKFYAISERGVLPNPEEAKAIKELDSERQFCIMDLDNKKRLLGIAYRWAGGISIVFTSLTIIYLVVKWFT